MLTLGLPDLEKTASVMWPSYLQLIAANMSSMMKDTSIPLYIQMVNERRGGKRERRGGKREGREEGEEGKDKWVFSSVFNP